ncbi:hypothetical protein QA635_08940 [Bradyrhizobium brasilense]|uniref:hypothetical protein n=1 Tax=Bradyrhizobium brasilense TaxID=1419277 RepID=UPI0024B1EE6A|nr:hypothetical protein [Bradyrhizobium australafricanum]WFU34508.1 hypothetical protein QA635_08940 [Bradyrhizobium australafricanum]
MFAIACPKETRMESILIVEFDTSRAAELAVEHVMQECGVQGTDVFVQPTGADNTSGDRPALADVKVKPKPGEKLGGPIEVSVDFHGDDPKRVADALKSVGAKAVRMK